MLAQADRIARLISQLAKDTESPFFSFFFTETSRQAAYCPGPGYRRRAIMPAAIVVNSGLLVMTGKADTAVIFSDDKQVRLPRRHEIVVNVVTG